MNDREDKCVDRIDECQVYEPEEEPIIPSPNAGANPWTVMVKLLDTVVTHGAVLRSWRTIDKAGATPFHQDTIFDLNKFGRHRWLDAVLWNNAGIHDSSTREVHHHQYPHHSREDGTNHVQIVVEPLPRAINEGG